MHKVSDIFVDETSLKTRVYMSEAAAKEFAAYQRSENPKHRFFRALLRYATNGFNFYTGKDGGRPIKPEWNGVFRIANAGLYRLTGFYDGVISSLSMRS